MDLSKLQNSPPPPVNPEIIKELTRIGGTVPYGKYVGQPVWRLAWGQSEKHFSLGKMRIQFLDRSIPPILHIERFFVSPKVFDNVAEWRTSFAEKEIDLEHRQTLGAFLKANCTDFLELPVSIATSAKLDVDLRSALLADVPRDWLYITDIKKVVEIGTPCWYVMRWIPSTKFGGREAWDKTKRYAYNQYIPELNRKVPVIDALGDYPETGKYIARYEIADFSEDKPKYLAPNRANCIEPVIKELYDEAALSAFDKNPSWQAGQVEEDLYAIADASLKIQQEHTADILGLN